MRQATLARPPWQRLLRPSASDFTRSGIAEERMGLTPPPGDAASCWDEIHRREVEIVGRRRPRRGNGRSIASRASKEAMRVLVCSRTTVLALRHQPSTQIEDMPGMVVVGRAGKIRMGVDMLPYLLTRAQEVAYEATRAAGRVVHVSEVLRWRSGTASAW